MHREVWTIWEDCISCSVWGQLFSCNARQSNLCWREGRLSAHTQSLNHSVTQLFTCSLMQYFSHSSIQSFTHALQSSLMITQSSITHTFILLLIQKILTYLPFLTLLILHMFCYSLSVTVMYSPLWHSFIDLYMFLFYQITVSFGHSAVTHLLIHSVIHLISQSISHSLGLPLRHPLVQLLCHSFTQTVLQNCWKHSFASTHSYSIAEQLQNTGIVIHNSWKYDSNLFLNHKW